MLTISQYAELVGVSEVTVRRRIKKGKLPARLEHGPYGKQYMIPAEAVDSAQAVTDVVMVNKPVPVESLAASFMEALEGRDRTIMARLEETATREDIQQLRQEMILIRESLLQATRRGRKQLAREQKLSLLTDTMETSPEAPGVPE